MTNTSRLFSVQNVTLAIFAVVAITLFGFTASAHAASYAYVTTTGEVKSVTADNWMTAINTAPGIHMHSGVLLLKEAGDFQVVGDDVPAF